MLEPKGLCCLSMNLEIFPQLLPGSLSPRHCRGGSHGHAERSSPTQAQKYSRGPGRTSLPDPCHSPVAPVLRALSSFTAPHPPLRSLRGSERVSTPTA